MGVNISARKASWSWTAPGVRDWSPGGWIRTSVVVDRFLGLAGTYSMFMATRGPTATSAISSNAG